MEHLAYLQLEEISVELLTDGSQFYWHACQPGCYPDHDSHSDELPEFDSLLDCITDAFSGNEIVELSRLSASDQDIFAELKRTGNTCGTPIAFVGDYAVLGNPFEEKTQMDDDGEIELTLLDRSSIGLDDWDITDCIRRYDSWFEGGSHISNTSGCLVRHADCAEYYYLFFVF